MMKMKINLSNLVCLNVFVVHTRRYNGVNIFIPNIIYEIVNY